MQILGIILLFGTIVLGFYERTSMKVSYFDVHALLVILLGSTSAIMLGSSRRNFLKTFAALRELIPGIKRLTTDSDAMDAEREKMCEYWTTGRRGQAVELAEKSKFESTRAMLQLLLKRASASTTDRVFIEMRHAAMEEWQPALNNWELLARLGPSFGMVGTITGMVQLFKNFGSENTNIGAAMSLALLATLYGVAFGAGIAGPIGHRLAGLLDERLGVLERCEKSVNDLVSAEER